MPVRIGTAKRGARGPLRDLGANIKWHMAKRQIKGLALAHAAGISPNTLTPMFYAGTRSPTLDNIQKVADVLDVPVWSLFLPPEDRDEP